MTSLERLNDELNRLFDLFNSEYYGGQLRKPVIAVQTNDKKEKSRLWRLFNVQDRFCPFAGGGQNVQQLSDQLQLVLRRTCLS